MKAGPGGRMAGILLGGGGALKGPWCRRPWGQRKPDLLATFSLGHGPPVHVPYSPEERGRSPHSGRCRWWGGGGVEGMDNTSGDCGCCCCLLLSTMATTSSNEGRSWGRRRRWRQGAHSPQVLLSPYPLQGRQGGIPDLKIGHRLLGDLT